MYLYIYIYISILYPLFFHSQLELHTALPALRPGTARYAAWQRRSTDLGAAPGERRHARPCGDPRDLGRAWPDRGTSKHGGLTIKNGGLTIKNGSLTSNKCGLTSKHGDLTSKSCNWSMKNRDSTIKRSEFKHANIVICDPMTSKELTWFMEIVGLRYTNSGIMEKCWV